jgi:Na+-transporting methylmalonyl-CoA/oxaloacetate decarboxylase gamma subunit
MVIFRYNLETATGASMELFSIQNIINGNGVVISIGGMSIVFAGLLVISIYIALLPKLLKIFSKKKVNKNETVVESLEAKYSQNKEIDEDKDLASVIGLVLQMEQERLVQSSNQVITIQRDRHSPSNWSKDSKMRVNPGRR